MPMSGFMNRCANCTVVVKKDTGQQFGKAWLDDYCLEILAWRGYLIGRDLSMGPGKVKTLLTIRRNGELVSYLAQRNFWEFRSTMEVKVWLKSLPDAELKPFEHYLRV